MERFTFTNATKEVVLSLTLAAGLFAAPVPCDAKEGRRTKFVHADRILNGNTVDGPISVATSGTIETDVASPVAAAGIRSALSDLQALVADLSSDEDPAASDEMLALAETIAAQPRHDEAIDEWSRRLAKDIIAASDE